MNFSGAVSRTAVHESVEDAAGGVKAREVTDPIFRVAPRQANVKTVALFVVDYPISVQKTR